MVQSSKERRNFCMLILKLIQYPDMTYNDLHYLLNTRYKIDANYIKTFEKDMSDLFNLGIEALFDFTEDINNKRRMIMDYSINAYSIAGLYIRRVAIKLERLSFPEMMSLHKNICLYYEKGVRSLALNPRRNMTGLNQTDSDSMLSNDDMEQSKRINESILDTETVHQDRNPHSKWSPKQAILFVTQQSDLLQNNELRALPPIELQNKLNEIQQNNPLSTQAYFLSYMNQLRLRDFFGAIDALHRSFDISPVQLMNQCEQKAGVINQI